MKHITRVLNATLTSLAFAGVATLSHAQEVHIASWNIEGITKTSNVTEMTQGAIYGTDDRVEIEPPPWSGVFTSGIGTGGVGIVEYNDKVFLVTVSHNIVENKAVLNEKNQVVAYTRTFSPEAEAKFYLGEDVITLSLEESDIVYVNKNVGQYEDYTNDIAVYDITSVSEGLPSIQWVDLRAGEIINIVGHSMKISSTDQFGNVYARSTFMATSCFQRAPSQKSHTKGSTNTDCDLSPGNSGDPAVVVRSGVPYFVGTASHFFVREPGSTLPFVEHEDGSMVTTVAYLDLK